MFPCGLLQRVAALQGKKTGCTGGDFPLQENLRLPPQRYLVSALLKVSSQILQNLVKKIKSLSLLVVFLVVENGRFREG